jgi:hypothetical protein
LEISHHIHSHYRWTEAVKIYQDIAEGQNPKDEPAVSHGLALEVRHVVSHRKRGTNRCSSLISKVGIPTAGKKGEKEEKKGYPSADKYITGANEKLIY